MRTTKISIAIDKAQLRLARRAAKTEDISLSAYIARGLRRQLDEQGRVDAARELVATWGPESLPTDAEREAFVAGMGRKRKRAARAA